MPHIDGMRVLVVRRRPSGRPGDRARPRRSRRRRRHQLPLSSAPRPRPWAGSGARAALRRARGRGRATRRRWRPWSNGRPRAGRPRHRTSTAPRGGSCPCSPQDVDEELWDAAFDSTAKGFFFAAQAAARQMLPGAGVIVAITDVAGLQPWPLFAPHGAAKAAQIHLVKTLALAWGRTGIRVCGVAPGPVLMPDGVRGDNEETALGATARPPTCATRSASASSRTSSPARTSSSTAAASSGPRLDGPGDAAVDADVLAGDVGGPVGGEEARSARRPPRPSRSGPSGSARGTPRSPAGCR